MKFVPCFEPCHKVLTTSRIVASGLMRRPLSCLLLVFILEIIFATHADGKAKDTTMPKKKLSSDSLAAIDIHICFRVLVPLASKIQHFEELHLVYTYDPKRRRWTPNASDEGSHASFLYDLKNTHVLFESQIPPPVTPLKMQFESTTQASLAELVTKNYKNRRRRNITQTYFDGLQMAGRRSGHSDLPETMGLSLAGLLGSNHPITIEVTPLNDTLISVYFSNIPQDIAILVNLPAMDNHTENSAILITMVPGSPPSYSGTITFISPNANSTVGFHIPPSPNGAIITVDVPQGIGVPQFQGRKTKIRLVHLGNVVQDRTINEDISQNSVVTPVVTVASSTTMTPEEIVTVQSYSTVPNNLVSATKTSLSTSRTSETLESTTTSMATNPGTSLITTVITIPTTTPFIAIIPAKPTTTTTSPTTTTSSTTPTTTPTTTTTTPTTTTTTPTTTTTTPTTTTTTPTTTTTTPTTTTTTPTTTTTTPTTTTTTPTTTTTTTTTKPTTTTTTPTTTTTTPTTTTTTPTTTTTTPTTTTTTPTTTTTTPTTTTTTPTTTTTTPTTTTTTTPTTTTTTPTTTTTTPTTTTAKPTTTTAKPTTTTTTPTTTTTTPTTTTTTPTTTTTTPTTTTTTPTTTTTTPTTTTTKPTTTTTKPTTTTTKTTTTTTKTTTTTTKPTTTTTKPTTTTTPTTITTTEPTTTTMKPTTTTAPTTATTKPTTRTTKPPTTPTTPTTTTPNPTTTTRMLSEITIKHTTSIFTTIAAVTSFTTPRSTVYPTSITTALPISTTPATALSWTTPRTTIGIDHNSPNETTTMSTSLEDETATTDLTLSAHPSTPIVTGPCPTPITVKASSDAMSLETVSSATTTSPHGKPTEPLTTRKTPSKQPPFRFTTPRTHPTKAKDVPPATYWLRTVIEAKPEEINKTSFVSDMKEYLQRAYNEAFFLQHRILLGIRMKRRNRRQIQTGGFVIAELINVTARAQREEAEIVYYLLHNGTLIPVNTAVKAMEDLDDQEAAIIFGHVVVIKAEPYLAAPTSEPYADEQQSIVLPAVLGSIAALLFLILVVIILYQCVYRRKRAGSSDLLGHGLQNRQQAFEEDVTSSVVTFEPGEGSKSQSGNLWTPVHKPGRVTSQIASTNTPPVPKRNRQKRATRPLPSLPGNVDYANVIPPHTTSTEKLIDESPPSVKRRSTIRRKRVPVDVYRADDSDYDDVPMAGGIFDHLRPPGYKAAPVRRKQTDTSEKQDDTDRPLPMPRSSTLKAVSSATQLLAATTQTEESAMARPMSLERSISHPQSSSEKDLIHAEMQMHSMRQKMQEVLDDAFSFWKDRKPSPRFHRSRLQPEPDSENGQPPLDQSVDSIRYSRNQTRQPMEFSESYLAHPHTIHSLHRQRSSWMLDNDHISEEDDVPKSTLMEQRQNIDISKSSREDAHHLTDPALLLNPRNLTNYSLYVAPSTSSLNQRTYKSNPLLIQKSSFIEPESISKPQQKLTPINGEHVIDIGFHRGVSRDPETQYLIKAIKKELQRFRNSYESDYSIV